MSTMTKTRAGTARRALLGLVAALGLMAALATPAAAGGKLGIATKVNKPSPHLFLAAIGEEIPTRYPSGASGSIVIPQ